MSRTLTPNSHKSRGTVGGEDAIALELFPGMLTA
jgi:hypothetical protein